MQHSSYLFRADALIGKMWTQSIKYTDSQALENRKCKHVGSTSIYLNTYILVQQACHDRWKHRGWYFQKIREYQWYVNGERWLVYGSWVHK